jgi:hypothetical protein
MTSPVFYKETIWQYTNIRVSCRLLAEPFTQGGMWRLIHICQVGFFVTSEISKMQSNPPINHSRMACTQTCCKSLAKPPHGRFDVACGRSPVQLPSPGRWDADLDPQ